MNALKHGLRSRGFGLLPEEDPAEWAEHLADLRRDLAPVDATEEKLVTALAVAMWKEIRADRTEAGVLTAHDGRRRPAATSATSATPSPSAPRSATAPPPAWPPSARTAPSSPTARPSRPGLILPVPAAEPAECTNDFPAAAARTAETARTNSHRPAACPSRPAGRPARPHPPPARRPRPADPAKRDLAAAILALPPPGCRALPRPDRPRSARPGPGAPRFDAAALAWLAGLPPAAAEP